MLPIASPHDVRIIFMGCAFRQWLHGVILRRSWIFTHKSIASHGTHRCAITRPNNVSVIEVGSSIWQWLYPIVPSRISGIETHV